MRNSSLSVIWRFIFARLRLLLLCAIGLAPGLILAKPVEFDLPAQPVADALLAFSRQAKIEVLFSFDELRKVTSTAISGRYEPEEALDRLLRDNWRHPAQ